MEIKQHISKFLNKQVTEEIRVIKIFLETKNNENMMI